MSKAFVTPWTGACQAPLCMGFPSQEYWSGVPFPSPGDLPIPGTEPKSPVWLADSLPWKPIQSLGEYKVFTLKEEASCFKMRVFRGQGEVF